MSPSPTAYLETSSTTPSATGTAKPGLRVAAASRCRVLSRRSVAAAAPASLAADASAPSRREVMRWLRYSLVWSCGLSLVCHAAMLLSYRYGLFDRFRAAPLTTVVYTATARPLPPPVIAVAEIEAPRPTTQPDDIAFDASDAPEAEPPAAALAWVDAPVAPAAPEPLVAAVAPLPTAPPPAPAAAALAATLTAVLPPSPSMAPMLPAPPVPGAPLAVPRPFFSCPVMGASTAHPPDSPHALAEVATAPSEPLPGTAVVKANADAVAGAPPSPGVANAATTGTANGTRADATPNASVGRGSPNPGPATAPNGALADSYRQQIFALLEARRRYPVAARRRNQQGVVAVSFRIAADGSVTDVRVTRASDFPVLNDAAFNLVLGCGPLPPPPGGAMELAVAFQYRLDKTR